MSTHEEADGGDGGSLDEAVTRALLPDFIPLAEDPALYFEIGSASVHLPLADLLTTRLRPEGVRSAATRMAEAAGGGRPRRAPVTVRRTGRAWTVVDGNSTVAVARLSRWIRIPCDIEAETPDTAPTAPGP